MELFVWLDGQVVVGVPATAEDQLDRLDRLEIVGRAIFDRWGGSGG